MPAKLAFILAVIVLPATAFTVFSGTHLGDASFHAPEFHVTFIGIAIALALALGILALRTHVAGGDARSLSIGAALLGFAAVYVWHGVFTRTALPFTFLVYGPASRIVFAATLLGLVSARRFTVAERMRNIVVVASGAIILSGIAYAATVPITSYASGATASTLNATRLALEGSALALAAVVVMRLALRRHKGKVEFILLAGVAFTAIQSIFFLPAHPWSVMWWSAHLVGGVGTLVLAWGTVVALQDEQHARALARVAGVERERAWFINMAAHELRTPLTPIKIQLHLLSRAGAAGAPVPARAVASIDRNVERLSGLIDDILLAARHQSQDDGPPSVSAIDLSRVVARVAEAAAEGAREDGVAIRSHVESGLFAAMRPDDVDHVLTILVTNGVTATPRGGRVDIEARRHDGSVVVRMTDEGGGLSPSEAARVFQPFADRESDPRGGRAGLQLYIVQRIIEAYGGRAWCENDEGREGTAFCFEVPFAGPARAEDGASIGVGRPRHRGVHRE